MKTQLFLKSATLGPTFVWGSPASFYTSFFCLHLLDLWYSPLHWIHDNTKPLSQFFFLGHIFTLLLNFHHAFYWVEYKTLFYCGMSVTTNFATQRETLNKFEFFCLLLWWKYLSIDPSGGRVVLSLISSIVECNRV